MVVHVFDRLPIGEMDNFHEWRENKFPYTFLCTDCKRGFDSLEEVDSCKFCGGPVKTLRSKHTVKSGFTKKTYYRHCCASCDETFTAFKETDTCPNCKSKFLHIYTWDTLGRRERLYIKTQRAIKNIFEKHAEKQQKQQRQQFKLPSIKLSLSKRSEEELPTY